MDRRSWRADESEAQLDGTLGRRSLHRAADRWLGQRNANGARSAADSRKMAVIIILYLLINYAYVRVIGFEQLKSAKNIAAIMASKVFGVNAERILSGLLFLSVLAYVNILLMSNPRVMAAMSDDKILPPAFKKRNLKTESLTISLSVFSALCILIIFFAKEFDAILSFTIFLDCFGMALSAGSIFIIRKKTTYLNNSGIFIMKLY